MDLKIKGKTAVITGSDSGIGLAAAKELAKEGANVLITGRNSDKITAAVEKIKKACGEGVSVRGHKADLKNNDEVLKLAEFTKSEMNGAAILVHCAGIHGAGGDFLSLSDEDWKETIDTDLMSAVRACRAFLPQMLDKKWGRIVLISSENALQPYIVETPYNACKAAIINLMKGLSRAYSPKGVMVNSVSPAFISTPMTDKMMEKKAAKENISKEEAIQQFLKEERPNIVVNRRGKPEEVATTIAYLCSDLASFITGSNYRVDGGSVSTAFG